MEPVRNIKIRPSIADGALLVLLVVLTVFFPRLLLHGGTGSFITVSASDTVTRIPLGVDARHRVSGPLGTAFVVVEKGKARLENAPCPLKICETMGPVDRSGEIIVCIPNRIVVEVDGLQDEDVDAVSR